MMKGPPTVKRVDAVPMRIPFTAEGAAEGLMPQRWTHLDIVLVRIETTDGHVGWGEAFAYSCLPATTAAVRDMVAPLLLGRAIVDIPALNRELQQKLHIQGRYGITMFAISGADIALWDIAAKTRRVSLAEHLGGRQREAVPAYASLVRYGKHQLVCRLVQKAVAEGYSHVKLHEILLPAIAAGRAGAGPKVRLMTDINCNWKMEEAEQMLAAVKALDLLWVEEPVFPPDDAEALSSLITRFGIAIAAGENACTAVEFARMTPAITFPQPSVTKVGGVTEFLNVCDLALIARKTPMPHSPYFGPGYWATLQLAGARTECGLFEYLWIKPEAWLCPDIPLPQAGQVAIPKGLGLGFEPDERVVQKYAVS